LVIDHINGGGRKQYKDEKNSNIYTLLKKLNFPDRDKYQVLCFKCNIKKERIKSKLLGICGNKRQKIIYKSRKKLKLDVASHYMIDGKIKCPYCEEEDLDILDIDHIKNDGSEHRRKERLSGGESTYRWIKKHNYPKDFRILCHSCNQYFRICNYNPYNTEDIEQIRHQTIKQSVCRLNYEKEYMSYNISPSIEIMNF
jgi:hypothetical protein